LGGFIGNVVDAATTLAQRAVESGADLAVQVVRDAGRVAQSFEDLMEVATREGIELAKETMSAVREATDRAVGETRSPRDASSADVGD